MRRVVQFPVLRETHWQGCTAELVSGDYTLLLRLRIALWPSDKFYLFAVDPQFGTLIDNSIKTTDRLIVGSRTVSTPSAWSSSQGMQSRIALGVATVP